MRAAIHDSWLCLYHKGPHTLEQGHDRPHVQPHSLHIATSQTLGSHIGAWPLLGRTEPAWIKSDFLQSPELRTRTPNFWLQANHSSALISISCHFSMAIASSLLLLLTFVLF